MEVKTDGGCSLKEYGIHFKRKMNIKKGNRVNKYISDTFVDTVKRTTYCIHVRSFSAE